MSTESTTEPAAKPRHMRADARRNRERIIAAGREVFKECGAEGTMDDVARRAGVGIGTLYRNFPCWNDLLEIVLADWVETVRANTRELLANNPPEVALALWFRRHVDKVRTHPGLSATLISNLDSPQSATPTKRAMREAGQQILSAAQASGAVKADITVDELLKLSYAVALATEQSPSNADRLIAVVMDGLRVPARAPSPT